MADGKGQRNEKPDQLFCGCIWGGAAGFMEREILSAKRRIDRIAGL